MSAGELVSSATPVVLLILGALMFAMVTAELSGRLRARVKARERKAELKARALLQSWLSSVQLARLESDGYFEVIGSHSGKRYRIRCRRHMNIDELDQNGARVGIWCFGPVGQLPMSDTVLAQKIALETDEPSALALANRA